MAVKRWTGSTWEIYAGADTSPGFAATDGRAGRRTWVGANTPTAPTDGDIWIDQDTATNSIPASAFDAKGDLMVGTGPDTYTRQAVGTDGQVLVADSTQADGVVWSHTPSRQGLVSVLPSSVFVSAGSASVAANGAITFSGAQNLTLDGIFSSLYRNYRLLFVGAASSNVSMNFVYRYLLSGTATDFTNSVYYTQKMYSGGSTTTSVRVSAAANGTLPDVGVDQSVSSNDIYTPHISGAYTAHTSQGIYIPSVGGIEYDNFGGICAAGNQMTGIKFSGSVTYTGTIHVYGYGNGA